MGWREGRGSGMKIWVLHYSWTQCRSMNSGWDLIHSLHMHISARTLMRTLIDIIHSFAGNLKGEVILHITV